MESIISVKQKLYTLYPKLRNCLLLIVICNSHYYNFTVGHELYSEVLDQRVLATIHSIVLCRGVMRILLKYTFAQGQVNSMDRCLLLEGFINCSCLLSIGSPSCRHTTVASSAIQLSSHTVPHPPPRHTSTRPSMSEAPPTSCTLLSTHWEPIEYYARTLRTRPSCNKLGLLA